MRRPRWLGPVAGRSTTTLAHQGVAVILHVKVRPNARSSSLTQQPDGSWRAQLKARPVNGKANAELIGMISKHFKCSKAAVVIKSGASGRNKILRVDMA